MNQCHAIMVRAKVMHELKIAMATRLIRMTYDLALVYDIIPDGYNARSLKDKRYRSSSAMSPWCREMT